MEPEFSMRSSSLNMPLQTSQSSINPNHIHGAMNQFQNTFDSIPSIPHSRPSDMKAGDDYGISQEFEDIGRYEEQKSSPHQNSIAIGGQSPFKAAAPQTLNNEASTDNIDIQNIGCNTNFVQTDEKQLNAVVDTKDCGSQAFKDVREAFCDGSIQTESKGSQFKTEAVSQEVNCQILRPENEEESISDEEGIVCFKCDGTKVNKKGLPCRRCNGSGALKNKLYTDLVKVIKEEIQSYTTQTFQRLMVDHLGKRAAEQASQIHDRVTCDGCGVCPIQGIRYNCSVCGNFDFCDRCEVEKVHEHPFLKIRKPEHSPAFIQC